ncbi:MAG TPA: type II toxin-antitoxin system antitoxin SocA domain-containing protein [Methylobacterium sp.]|jgi:hypothetical protein|uniref:SocA family protein n=1 Tax=Methylorubrum sp. B1-46 TaxID=2897334 RepID=UPI001E323587|nr:SocA family protein [Methylorubrum sp. B1-46]UGB27532.1 SocA family protein [Methylorubrum sp. B1-46]HEV2544905.1 type II toxin-antitoxin system antitoxin SocA domain-containing protein [Methylobacterium sp.]
MEQAADLLKHLDVDKHISVHDYPKLIFLIYLADWKSAIERGSTISGSDWKRLKWGPFSRDLFAKIVTYRNSLAHGAPNSVTSKIDTESAMILENIKKSYMHYNYEKLLDLILSTYPMVRQSNEQSLNLPALAEIYKKDFRKARERVGA